MENQKIKKNFWKNPFVIVCLIGIGYWVYTYHWQHALGFLPYLILLLCPLLHIFMHGHHGGHSSYSIEGDSSHNHREEK